MYVLDAQVVQTLFHSLFLTFKTIHLTFSVFLIEVHIPTPAIIQPIRHLCFNVHGDASKRKIMVFL